MYKDRQKELAPTSPYMRLSPADRQESPADTSSSSVTQQAERHPITIQRLTTPEKQHQSPSSFTRLGGDDGDNSPHKTRRLAPGLRAPWQSPPDRGQEKKRRCPARARHCLPCAEEFHRRAEFTQSGLPTENLVILERFKKPRTADSSHRRRQLCRKGLVTEARKELHGRNSMTEVSQSPPHD